jgi:hypothetical protein
LADWEGYAEQDSQALADAVVYVIALSKGEASRVLRGQECPGALKTELGV